jgi:hypothetical protein
MVKKGGGAKPIKFENPEARRPAIPGVAPEEGVRLVRAFVAVRDPRLRDAIMAFVENLS